jgi:hypothetical protein
MAEHPGSTHPSFEPGQIVPEKLLLQMCFPSNTANVRRPGDLFSGHSCILHGIAMLRSFATLHRREATTRLLLKELVFPQTSAEPVKPFCESCNVT